MWCSYDRKNVSKWQLVDDPVWGWVHADNNGWHTVGGTLLDGVSGSLVPRDLSCPRPLHPPALRVTSAAPSLPARQAGGGSEL